MISIHSPRKGRDLPVLWGKAGAEKISIHSPRMGRDDHAYGFEIGYLHFNPLSPHGERQMEKGKKERLNIFQSTLPAWGETSLRLPKAASTSFQSTLPAWGETPAEDPAECPAPFQSTLPAWGETSIHDPRRSRPKHFNPLSPHGERHGAHGLGTGTQISIHSPRMGRDRRRPVRRLGLTWHFNPLSPHGERRWALGRPLSGTISIHSPRMGRDPVSEQVGHAAHISIHSPRMGRDGQ